MSTLRAYVWVVAGVAAILLMACSPTEDREGAAGDVSRALPTEIAGWRASGTTEVFDAESIYQYIDGHAEVYLAYGMKRCLSQRYQGPEGEPAIVLDLFELASAADAYGVFTHDRDGEPVDIGQEGLMRPGWLSFWKGSWFGSVYAEGETDRAEQATIAIATAAADAIDDEGSVPELVSALPADGLDTRSVRFFHTQEILNSVVYLGFDNVLQFGPEIDAVVGRYQREDGEGWLLLVDYPDEAAAGVAEGRGSEAGLPVLRSGRRLAAVLAPQPASAADGLLADALGGGR
jgi:hypothetical protein